MIARCLSHLISLLAGNRVTLSQYHDPHIAAVLIKKFLRELPEPIFPGSLYSIIAKCPPSTGWGADGLSGPPSKGAANGTHGPANDATVANGSHEKGHKRVGSEAELATVGGWGEGDACVEYIREVLLPAMGWGCRVVLLDYIFRKFIPYLLVVSHPSLIGLLHDVALRSSANKMDAHNLALCITPNLVKSNDPIRDIKVCAVPGAASMSWNSPGATNGARPPLRKAGTTTLGDIVRVCIERYFEIFPDVPDRGDALPVPLELKFEDGVNSHMANAASPSIGGPCVLVGSPRADGSSTTSTTSPSSTLDAASGETLFSSVTTLESVPRSSIDIEDEELNEAMLVMSVVPQPEPARSPKTSSPNARAGSSPLGRSAGSLPPSAWSRSPKLGAGIPSPGSGLSPGKSPLSLGSPASSTTPVNRHRRTTSSTSTTFSTPLTTSQGSTSGPGSTIRGARSVISIERVGTRKGSIALGRSGGAGASGVAAMSVTATGFFERP